MKKELLNRIQDMEKLASEIGLDFFPTIFEVVDRDIMLEACSYGLPVRSRHWSYGRTYQQQKIYGEMGLSKVYEIVFNNDPSYAFLMNTNKDAINIMVAAHVFGHCIKHDELVETLNGPKQIKNIVPGDLVMTHTGRYNKVLDSKETTKSREIYSIKAYGYPEVSCTSDHKFMVKRKNKCIWVQAKDLKNTDLMMIPRLKPKNELSHVNVPIHISRSTPLRKKALAKNGGYKIKLDYDFGRIVGLYLAEGSISKNRFMFALGGSEIECANFVKSFFEKIGITVKIKDRRPKQYCLDVQCFDKSFAKWLDDTFGHGCNNKGLPSYMVNSASADFYKGMLRGYFDGDGWVKDGFTAASASTTSTKLAYQIKNICSMYGIKVGVRSRKRVNRKLSYSIIATGENYDKVLDICGIKRSDVPKRRWLFNEIDDDFIYNRIKEVSVITSDQKIPMWDLEVENDHSFVLCNGAIAHNCHFFKNNVMFQGSDRSMVYRAAERARRVDEYIEKYGLEAVEHIMDIGFALDNHIDWTRGIFRDKYPKKRIIKQIKKRGEFEDLLNIGDNSRRSVVTKVVGDSLPPHPEKDLLWFLINYATLDDWEKDILGIIREESYYFYPIVMTKISNEGFACVTGDTLVYTSDGIKNMYDIVSSSPKSVYDGNKDQSIVHSGVFKNRDVIRIKTTGGFSISGANNHRIMLQDGEWKRLDELQIGDTVKLSKGNGSWGKEQNIDYSPKGCANPITKLCSQNGISYNTYSRFINGTHKTKKKNIEIINKIQNIMKNQADRLSPSSCNRKAYSVPKTVDEDFASFLGYMIGDGHICGTTGRHFGLTTGDEESKQDFVRLCKNLFGIDPKIKWDDTSKNGRWRILAYSLGLVDFLTEHIGLHKGICANVKEVPDVILKSPKSVMSAFLRSYFDADGCASITNGVILSTSSNKLAEQVQIILLNYGIISRRRKAKDGCWQLRINGKSAKIFSEEIGFGLERKHNNLKKYISDHKFFCKENWTDTIECIENRGKMDVYDISVENTHRYAAAGFINHNSFMHAELMYKCNSLSETEYLDFAKVHSSVINPGGNFNLNPYYLGFMIYTDIREKWDRLYKNGESEIDGLQKVIQVANEEDDASFLRNYLTKELAAKLGLFNYGYKYKRRPHEKEEDLSEKHGIIELKDRDLDKIIENIIRPTLNYGAPLITIDGTDGDVLILAHNDDFGPLDRKYTEKTMEYIYELWGGPVELKTYAYSGEEVVYNFDESGFEIL